MRSRRLDRKPLNRLRSGEGLFRPRRPQKQSSSVLVIVLVLLLLVLVSLVVVATVTNTNVHETADRIHETAGRIRKRTLQHFYHAQNSDERPLVDEEGEALDSKSSRKHSVNEKSDGETPVHRNTAMEDEIQAKDAALLEEEHRRQEREEQMRREFDEQLQQLKLEKERLERQLREEEEARLLSEKAAKEAEKLKEEELLQRIEEEARLKKLEEEREQERLELLRKEEERIKEQEAKRREREEEEEVRRQRQLQQEQELQRQREQQNGLENRAGGDGSMERQPKFSFCEFMRRKPGEYGMNEEGSTGFSNPAVLVLGMEDTSTDLVWHVISQVLYPGQQTVRRTHELLTKETAIEYNMLDMVGEEHQMQFWSKISDKSRGRWLVHVFCQQQEHDVAAGFPWLTSPDRISDNKKAQDSLELIRQIPKGSMKILRIKRNKLDVLIRQAQQEEHLGAGKPVPMNPKQLFSQLRQVEAEQDAVDKYLEKNNIPHLTLDFEKIFPFEVWPDLIVAAQSYQANPTYINLDWRQLPSQLESTWRDVLRYLDVIYKPVSMFDILRDAMQTHQVNTFWSQKDAIEKFPYIERNLQGTHFEVLIRKKPPSHVTAHE